MNAVYLIIFLISAAMLAFQVSLTRFFALAQGHHFAFMAISLALLGLGASGTYLSLRPPAAVSWRRPPVTGALGFTLSLPAAYLITNYLPFDAYRLAWEPVQLLWLGFYYLALTVPFFFGGLVIGSVLTTHPERAGTIYGINMVGSGLGPPLALVALATVGGPGAVIGCTLLGWLAVISAWLSARDTGQITGTQRLLVIGFGAAITMLLLFFTVQPPAVFRVQLTPYKSLSQAQLYPGSQLVFSQWNAVSRVDVLQSEGIRSAPGLSFTYPGELPPQLGLMIDGDNLSPITESADPAFTRYLPLALAFQLRPGASTLILEPGGGLAVLTARAHGAGPVTVVQSNPTALAAVREIGAALGRDLYNDPAVTVIVDDPRSFLRRSNQQFDLILMPLTDSYHPVTAGAYTLAEDYRYTVEAFSAMLAHLDPDGLLVIERWLQLPPSESLRLWGTAIAAVRRSLPEADPAAHLLVMRSLQTSLLVAGRAPLSAADLATARDFSAELQFDPVWLPDIEPDEANRYSIVPDTAYYQAFTALLTAANPANFYAAYPYAVAPPTDNHPFFFHFFKWQQTPEILQTLGKTWQPFGGSGYLVLILLLGLVLVLSTVLILMPLAWLKDDRRPAGGWSEEREGGHPPAAPRASGVWLKDDRRPAGGWSEEREGHPPAAPRSSGVWLKDDRMSERNSEGIGALPTGRVVRAGHLRLRYLLYFALLGLGFLFVEIPLLQRFILYLGQPAYAFTVVVAAVLFAAGVGSSYLSPRLSLRLALPLLVLLTMTYPLLVPWLFDVTLHLSFAGRVVVAVVALFPLGALLGVPFPAGMVLVGETAPGLAPWAWAVNGCASVVSAVLAALVALTWGFSAVLWGAALAYGLAAVAIWALLVGPREGHKADSAPVGP